jgi:hypothetical protein
VGLRTIDLDRPQANLELLLPHDWLPPGALAAWTGRVLVVAHAKASGVVLTRHGCKDGTFATLADAEG